MKILLLLIAFVLTGCGNHSFMNNAFVGNVDNKAVAVLFDAGTRNGVKYYRPQLQSDCGRIYNPIYQMDNGSTICLIRDSRITHLKLYNTYMAKVIPNATDSIYER
ncbi:TPA: hypothetical protein ACSXT8_004640 [Escherichia coli]|nr:hypothetical protein [Escherichia coli]